MAPSNGGSESIFSYFRTLCGTPHEATPEGSERAASNDTTLTKDRRFVVVPSFDTETDLTCDSTVCDSINEDEGLQSNKHAKTIIWLDEVVLRESVKEENETAVDIMKQTEVKECVGDIPSSKQRSFSTTRKGIKRSRRGHDEKRKPSSSSNKCVGSNINKVSKYVGRATGEIECKLLKTKRMIRS